VLKALLNGNAVEAKMETVESTVYATAQVQGRGVHRLQLELV